MANTSNQCVELEVGSRQLDENDGLYQIYNVQRRNQTELYGHKYDGLSIKEIADMWLRNKHSLEDELGEMMDALGGINDGIGSASWKSWKKQHAEAEQITIEDLSQEDLKELKMEIVDAWHFMLNFSISIGMTADEIYNYFMSKNRENIARQERGY